MGGIRQHVRLRGSWWRRGHSQCAAKTSTARAPRSRGRRGFGGDRGLVDCARSSPVGEGTMAETARMAVFHGAGKPFEIREYPVPEPEPGAILVRVALANVCGSDLHYWRGELDYVKMGRPLPLNTGHEH